MKRDARSFSIQGLSPHTLAERCGTPVYVYDGALMAERLEEFRAAFEGLPLKVHFAAKALTNMAVLKHFCALGVGLETVSVAELRMGLRAGFAPSDIIFTPNFVDFGELREAVESGVHVTLDNLDALARFGRSYGTAYPCALRLNPGLDARHAGNDEAARWYKRSKFGIPWRDLGRAKALCAQYKIPVEGLHVHSSHVVMSPELLAASAAKVLEEARNFERLRFVNFGGGLRPRGERGHRISLAPAAKALRRAFGAVNKERDEPLELWLEPGRYLVAEAGCLLSRCTGTKTHGSVRFAGLDTGFHHLLRPKLYGARHELLNLSNPEGKTVLTTVCGRLCEVDDFAVDRPIAELRAGDLVAILDVGAYGFQMSSNYNSLPRPPEVLVTDGVPRLIRSRESFDDLLRDQVDERLAL